MLVDLEIENLAVLERQRLALAPGLTAITGESGAGKSLILRAIDLAAGGRADPTLVRPGSSQARVRLRARLDGVERTFEREIRRDGRSLAAIDGRAARLTEVRALIAPHLGIGRQGDAYRLREAGALAWIDRVDGVRPVLVACQAAARRVDEIRAELTALGAADPAARAKRVDYLRYALAEIEEAAVSVGEREALRHERDRLRGIERLRAAVAAAHERLVPDGEEAGAYELLAGAAQALEPVAALEPALEPLARSLAELRETVRDHARDLARISDRLVPDPAREEEVGARLDRLQELDRKYGGDEAAVLAFAEAARDELAALEGADDRLAALARAAATAEAAWREAAGALTAARTVAARALELSAAQELSRLALPEARLFLRVVPDPAAAVAAAGWDRLEALFAADAYSPLLALGDVASGGEASRVLLALEAALAIARPGGTWLFDEVEAGVGGSAAWNVASTLMSLSRLGQVLLVSHLAPVAAVADVQLAVSKRSGVGGETTSEVRPVRDGERVRELVRMLSGEGAAAERHARELLERARELAHGANRAGDQGA